MTLAGRRTIHGEVDEQPQRETEPAFRHGNLRRSAGAIFLSCACSVLAVAGVLLAQTEPERETLHCAAEAAYLANSVALDAYVASSEFGNARENLTAGVDGFAHILLDEPVAGLRSHARMAFSRCARETGIWPREEQ